MFPLGTHSLAEVKLHLLQVRPPGGLFQKQAEAPCWELHRQATDITFFFVFFCCYYFFLEPGITAIWPETEESTGGTCTFQWQICDFYNYQLIVNLTYWGPSCAGGCLNHSLCELHKTNAANVSRMPFPYTAGPDYRWGPDYTWIEGTKKAYD